jgi:pimeloyl-ACP methyl ester carboxylesterase
MLSIYVASSWSNSQYPSVISALRAQGFDVFDFRASGFSFAQLDPAWEHWQYRDLLAAYSDERVQRQFAHDIAALRQAAAIVVIKPAGYSAGCEAGFAAALGKPLFVLHPIVCARPDVLDQLAAVHVSDIGELLAALDRYFAEVTA